MQCFNVPYATHVSVLATLMMSEARLQRLISE